MIILAFVITIGNFLEAPLTNNETTRTLSRRMRNNGDVEVCSEMPIFASRRRWRVPGDRRYGAKLRALPTVAACACKIVSVQGERISNILPLWQENIRIGLQFGVRWR